MHIQRNLFRFDLYCLLMIFFISAVSPLYSESKVAILGESFNSESGSLGVNEEVLSRLFDLIRQKQPDAVIFTGNMTLGLEENKSKETSPTKFVSSLPSTIDAVTEENLWPREGFQYVPDTFRKQLENFVSIKNTKLGDKIPFYPILGNHEAFGNNSAAQVKTIFNVKSIVPESVSPLAYTFALKNALFILFSNAQFDPHTQSTIVHTINDQLLDWINQILRSQRQNYDFVFVVGNEPAFSTTAVDGIYKGLDKNANSRNRFWSILLDNQVTAYFCSEEHIYDRTNRYGIWQIISGGGGAPLYKRAFDKAFYHFLLLSIPGSSQELPKVQVFDSQGNMSDEFDLSPSKYPVYQLRISQEQ